MLNGNRLKTLYPLLVVSFAFSISLFAFVQTNSPTPRKVAEFIGDVDYEDLIARLDNFAIELQNQPQAQGHIIVYRSRRDPPGISHRYALRAKNYLVRERGIDPRKVITIDGGMSGCLMYELWLAPAGAAITERRFTYRYPRRGEGPAYLYDTLSIYLPHDEVIAYNTGHESHEYLDAFASELKANPNSRGYLIAYAQYCRDCQYQENRPRGFLDPVGTNRSVLTDRRNYLIRTHGISPSRIVTIDGGYRRWREIELWIVPQGANAPIPTPNQFPQSRRRR